MPDTGAPYFIPFADPTDLVRDWPALSEDVAEAVADGLDEAGSAGIGSNVVQTVKTDTFSTTSGTFEDVTGLAVTITPTSNTSKILIIADVSISTSATTNNTVQTRLVKAGSAIYVGDADGSRTQAAMSTRTAATSADSAENRITSRTITFLDSPEIASAVTYGVQVRSDGGGTGFINRTGGISTVGATVASSITAIEVSA